MSMFNVAIINGDGYSEILTAAAKKVLTAVSEKLGFSLNFHPVDARAFLGKSESEILKTDEYKVVKSADAAIAGAFSSDFARGSVHDDVITLICKNLGLFGCFRSIKSFYNTINCSALNDKDEVSNVDFLIVHDIAARQFVEKGYKTGKVGREAYDVVTLPEMYAERIGRVAYELAEKRKNRLASVDLADTFNTEFLRRKITHEINEDYPLVNLTSYTLESVVTPLLFSPSSFDVIVANENASDTLFSLGAAISGGFGNLCEGYLGDAATGLYKPAKVARFDAKNPHGVNPAGIILAAAKMLEYSFDKSLAKTAVENAVEEVISQNFVTHDMKNGRDETQKVISTEEFTDEVIKRL